MTELALNGGPKAAADLAIPEWPRPTDRSREYVLDCVASGAWCRLGEDATWVDRFEAAFADYHDAEHAIAVGNGTVAIELALRACGVESGDEVLVPAYTFVATASAVACVGAIPRFVDVDPATVNLDPASLRERITPDTTGIVGVHFAGYPLDFDEVLPIVREHDLFLIEDAAHAQGTEWRGERVGTIGDVGTFSFQESKSLPGGEGGMVVTDDDLLAERLRLRHNIGRDPEDPGYKHYVAASNYRLPELQGALLTAQLEDLPAANERRRATQETLDAALADVAGIHTAPPDDRITNRGYCVYTLRYDADDFDGLDRDRFVAALAAEGLPASDGYQLPLYRQPAFARDRIRSLLPPGTEVPRYNHKHLPGTEEVVATNVTFPHTLLLAEETADVLPQAIEKIHNHATELQ